MTALYRALRLPEPDVIVTDDPVRFRRGAQAMASGVTVPETVFYAVLSIMAIMPAALAIFDQAPAIVVVGMLCSAILVVCLAVLNAAVLVEHPFHRGSRRAHILADALGSAGAPTALPMDKSSTRHVAHTAMIATCLARPVRFRSGLVVWGAFRPVPAEEVPPVTDDGTVVEIALELRHAVDGAVLGEHQAFLLLAGSGSAWSSPGPVRRWLLGRLVRRAGGLGSGAARFLFDTHGPETCFGLLGAKPSASDQHGSLWGFQAKDSRVQWLQTPKSASTGGDWIRVPGDLETPREAAVWFYGQSAGRAPTSGELS